MQGNVIDLTQDSDQEHTGRPRKRARLTPTSQQLVLTVASDSDDDVVLVVKQPRRLVVDSAPLADDEDLIITGDKGDVALRDFPHNRPDCVEHAFTSGHHASNSTTCNNCYCYVCDKAAADCEFWGTGLSAGHHCNAKPGSKAQPYWEDMRKAARSGNRSVLAAGFARSTAAVVAAHRQKGSSAGQSHPARTVGRPPHAQRSPTQPAMLTRRSTRQAACPAGVHTRKTSKKAKPAAAALAASATSAIARLTASRQMAH